MTDLRKAAKGALEALTNCNSAYGHRCIRCDSEVDEGGKVASALRAALAQQEEPVWMHPWPPVRAQQDEPVQEPVAWLYEAGADSTLHWNKPPLYGTPLYTAPPQRQPLTEEEIDRICASLGFAAISPAEIVRAVERAHGIGETK